MPEISISEAVRSYQLHPNTVARLILTQRLSARKDVNGHWLISRASLDAYTASRKPKTHQQAELATA